MRITLLFTIKKIKTAAIEYPRLLSGVLLFKAGIMLELSY